MRGNVKGHGIVIGNMRFDSISPQNLGKGLRNLLESEPQAKKARERMKEYGTNGSLTDAIVRELGGNRAAENQANAYHELLDGIKAGKTTSESGETAGSLAEQARKKMIERQGSNDDTENGGHPDIGRDKANRQAYPKRNDGREPLAKAARQLMIEREQNSFSTRQDTEKRFDSTEEAAVRNYAEARESAKALANAWRC